MKSRLFFAGMLLVAGALSACKSYQPVVAGTKPIVLAASEKREAKLGKYELPAGEYLPDFQNKQGIFYVAPTSVVATALGVSSPRRGGLFIPFPSEKDQRQGVWAAYDSGGSTIGVVMIHVGSGTGQISVFRFDQRINFTVK